VCGAVKLAGLCGDLVPLGLGEPEGLQTGFAPCGEPMGGDLNLMPGGEGGTLEGDCVPLGECRVPLGDLREPLGDRCVPLGEHLLKEGGRGRAHCGR